MAHFVYGRQQPVTQLQKDQCTSKLYATDWKCESFNPAADRNIAVVNWEYDNGV